MGLIQAHPLWVAAFAVAVINVPFGFWREGTRRFSLRWWLAVHLPVPAVVGLRLWLKLGWRFSTFAALVSSYCLGQAIGARLRRWRAEKVKARQTQG